MVNAAANHVLFTTACDGPNTLRQPLMFENPYAVKSTRCRTRWDELQASILLSLTLRTYFCLTLFHSRARILLADCAHQSFFHHVATCS